MAMVVRGLMVSPERPPLGVSLLHQKSPRSPLRAPCLPAPHLNLSRRKMILIASPQSSAPSSWRTPPHLREILDAP